MASFRPRIIVPIAALAKLLLLGFPFLMRLPHPQHNEDWNADEGCEDQPPKKIHIL